MLSHTLWSVQYSGSLTCWPIQLHSRPLSPAPKESVQLTVQHSAGRVHGMVCIVYALSALSGLSDDSE